MAQDQSDNSFADTPLINDQWYESDYGLWDPNALADSPGLEPAAGRGIPSLLFMILAANIAWVIFIGTTTIREIGIPVWVGWLPYIFTWLILLVPTITQGRLIPKFSIGRFALMWFLAGIAFSLANHPLVINGVLRLIGFLLVASVAYILIPASYSWDKIIRTLRGTIVWAAAISLGISVLFFPVVAIDETKASGIFFNRNTMGFVAFLGLAALGGALPKKRWRVIIHIGLMFFFGVMLLISRARASIGSALICGLLVFWHYRRRFSMWLIGIVTLVSLLIFGLLFTSQGESLVNSILYKGGVPLKQGVTDKMTSGRLSIWREIRYLSRGHELSGLGIGSLWSYYNVSPHSAYIALLGELGYIWFPGFVLWVLTVIWEARSLRKYCSPEAAALVQSMFVMLVGIAVFNLFENSLGGLLDLPVFVFWIGAGAISNAAVQARYQGYLESG